MAKELKTFPVEDQEQALQLIDKLKEHYDMAPDLHHEFMVSNEHYTAYYDPQSKIVKMEAIHPDTTEEQIREFLIHFPPFF